MSQILYADFNGNGAGISRNGNAMCSQSPDRNLPARIDTDTYDGNAAYDDIHVMENTPAPGSIDVSRLVARRQLPAGSIAPASEEVEFVLAGEHKAEPIKSLDDINRISQYLICQRRYRDNMLFICGINFGLRISDLLRLRF